jgi:transcriptional regulator with XRE-family HTH domain
MSIDVETIPRRELLAYQADVKGSIFRQIRQKFAQLKQRGFTQKEWAARINMDEGQLSRRVRGDFDLQLETLSDLARGLECRIAVELMPLDKIASTAPDYASRKSSPESGGPSIEQLFNNPDRLELEVAA